MLGIESLRVEGDAILFNEWSYYWRQDMLYRLTFSQGAWQLEEWYPQEWFDGGDGMWVPIDHVGVERALVRRILAAVEAID